MKVQLVLVFHDWIEELTEKSLSCTEKGMELSLGRFHSGAMFSAEIEIEDYREFESAAKDGIVPVFYALLAKEGTK